MKLLIVSGMSGAGKSSALHVLEDMEYYCIDNLPAGLVVEFAKQMTSFPSNTYKGAAIGIDVRNLTDDLMRFSEIVAELDDIGVQSETIVFDAADEVLLKRFSETRRRHPLASKEIALAEAIQMERNRLSAIFEQADLHIDTSSTNIKQLRDVVKQRVVREEVAGMSLLFESFGFKHGVPTDVNFVFDVRCLPNPHWDQKLRPLTGRDRPVAEFLEQHENVERMFVQIRDLVETWLPKFEEENRCYLNVSIGCTGGQHRSVYLVQRLTEYFSGRCSNVLTRHRELQ